MSTSRSRITGSSSTTSTFRSVMGLLLSSCWVVAGPPGQIQRRRAWLSGFAVFRPRGCVLMGRNNIFRTKSREYIADTHRRCVQGDGNYQEDRLNKGDKTRHFRASQYTQDQNDCRAQYHKQGQRDKEDNPLLVAPQIPVGHQAQYKLADGETCENGGGDAQIRS